MPPRARKERVIEPSKIKDSLQWADAYNGQYKNITFGPNGELQVLDVDLRAIVKSIPHLHGYDSVVALAKELRTPIVAGATLKQDEIRKSIESNTESARELYLSVERDLLTATEQWKEQTDVNLRRILVLRIGELTKQLQEADTQMRQAMYPFRYLKKEERIPKLLIDYQSHDERNVMVSSVVLQKTDVQSRSFTVADMA